MLNESESEQGRTFRPLPGIRVCPGGTAKDFPAAAALVLLGVALGVAFAKESRPWRRDGMVSVLALASLVAIVPPSVPNLRFTPGQPLSFELVVDTAPKVEVKDWKGYPLKRRIRKVEAAQVESMLQQLREESAVFEDVSRPAGDGDVVLIDVQRLDANGQRLKGTLQKGARILLGAPELLPDLQKGLLGAEAGQERTVTVNYPADYRQTDMAGQAIGYVIKIRQVQFRRLRELDDAFAKEIFGLESLAQLRERIDNGDTGRGTCRGPGERLGFGLSNDGASPVLHDVERHAADAVRAGLLDVIG